MIPEPCDTNREVPVNETFHVQTDDELTENELKQIEADDQAIQTILLGLPEDIYAVEKKAKLFNEWERFTSNEGELTESYYHHFLKLMNDLKQNKHFPEKIASNLKFLNNLQPEWSRHGNLEEATTVKKAITLLRQAIGSSPGENTKTAKPESTRVDLDCVHAEDGLHLYRVHVVQDMHEANQTIALLRQAIGSSPGEKTGTAKPESIRGDSVIDCVET
nr:hypothetical protein [Tanacetum cinerariifolium]